MQKFLLYPKKKAIILPQSFEPPAGVIFKEVEYRGKVVRVVRDDLKNYYALKPSLPDLECPIYRHYDWPDVDSNPEKPAMQHQKDGAAFIVDNFRSWNTSEMGTGKSVTMIYAADYLIKEGFVKKVLILSPLSTLNRVWADTLFNTFLHTGYSWTVLHRKDSLKRLNDDFTFYIANHNFIGVASKKSVDAHGNVSYSLKSGFERLSEFDLILFDEMDVLRSGDSLMFNSFRSMLKEKQRLVLASGTPNPSKNTDPFWPSKLVNPNATPKYFGAFRKMVMYPVKNGQFETWHNKEGVAEIVFKAMTPCFRVKKSDVIELPPVTYERREVEMSENQKKVFKQMLKDMSAEVGGRRIDAVNAAAKIGKLHQILCGAVKDGDDYIEVDCEPRAKVTVECIKQSLSKTLVVAPYKGILRYLNEYINKAGYKSEIINGDVSASRRDEIFKQFAEDDSLRVLCVHPKTMSHGLTLTNSSTMVFVSALRGNLVYRQVLQRQNRPGQKNKMTVVQIAGHPLEWKMYDSLDNQEDNQQSVLAIYDSLFN